MYIQSGTQPSLRGAIGTAQKFGAFMKEDMMIQYLFNISISFCLSMYESSFGDCEVSWKK